MKIGIISDIHENVEKLLTAIKLAESHKCDELVCLGDIVGFDQRFYNYNTVRSAKKCIEIIRSNFRWIVAGNHDLFATKRFPAFSNGFSFPRTWFQMNADERKKSSMGKVWCYDGDAPNDLEEEDIIFMKSLPEYLTIPFAATKVLFSHYIYPDFTGSTTQYIEKNRHLNDHWGFMDLHDISLSFSGHSHISFAGFAYQVKINGIGSFFKAVHSVPLDNINLGAEKTVVLLPPLSGDKGRSGFSIIDSEVMKLQSIAINNI
jgi:predicted phosphodiesterase